MAEVTQVQSKELQELYAKAYAFKEAVGQFKDEQIQSGYLRYLSGTPEGLIKLKVAYDQMYPDLKEGSELLDKEIEKSLRFDPAMVAVYLKNIVKDLADLYGKAFKLFLENMQSVSSENTKKVQEERVVASSLKSEASSPTRLVARTYDIPILEQSERPKQKISLWQKLRGHRKSVERVNKVDISKEREAVAPWQAKTAKSDVMSELEIQRRLERYNANVRARAQANQMQQSFTSEMARESVMQRGA